MSLMLWSIDELRKYVSLSEEVYERAKKIGGEAGRRFYDGLMIALDLRGSVEAAIKYVDIQYRAAMPIAILDEKNLWNINYEFLEKILRQIDASIPFKNIVREGKSDPSKFVGSKRLSLRGAWGEIIAFYILNEPLPKLSNILYLLHLAAYVTTFTTATIPEIYTGSEEFLELIEKVNTKKGAIDFLTRLLRRRYIPEDLYSDALEAVDRRRELTFESLRDVLEEHEARAYLAETLVKGIHGIILRLQDLVEKSGNRPIPRENLSVIVGEVSSFIKGLERTLEEYRSIVEKLNNLLIRSGRTINPDKIRALIEELRG